MTSHKLGLISFNSVNSFVCLFVCLFIYLSARSQHKTDNTEQEKNTRNAQTKTYRCTKQRKRKDI